MKKINTVLLNARKREKEDFVQLATQLATLKQNGIEDVEATTKELLNMPEDSIFLLEATDALKKINKDTQDFVAFGNALGNAKLSGLLTEEELAPLDRVYKNLEESIMKIYKIEDVEDLYMEEE